MHEKCISGEDLYMIYIVQFIIEYAELYTIVDLYVLQYRLKYILYIYIYFYLPTPFQPKSVHKSYDINIENE